VHNGVTHHAAATEALTRFREQGGTVVLITNAPRAREEVLRQLDGFGVPRAAYDGLVTSGEVSLSLIVEAGVSRLSHIGEKRDKSLFAALHDRHGIVVEFVEPEAAELAVCTGLFESELHNLDFYDPLLDRLHAHGLPFICANPDIVVHVGEELFYCAGALAERYSARGGKVLQAGKPFPRIYAEAFELAASLRAEPLARSRILAIGDAMHTDIKGAHNEKLDALFVTSGIHRDELQGAMEGDELDAAAVRQFAEDLGFAPWGALARLVW
jgi:HAD superfamily hydrolase (TIGR01459 family)